MKTDEALEIVEAILRTNMLSRPKLTIIKNFLDEIKLEGEI